MATIRPKLVADPAQPAGESLPEWLLDTDQTLQELLKLKPNWNSYGAQPIRPDVVRAVRDLLPDIVQQRTPRPTVVPTVRGGVQLEWHAGGIDLELEIEAPGQFHVLFENPNEDVELEARLDSSQISQLSELCARLLPSQE